MAEELNYRCRTASETLEWINAIIDFLKPYRFFLDAHVVNFFKDRMWEAVDKEWMDCLRNEPIENLVMLPSGVVQDNWPDSLKKFVLTLRHLSLSREAADLRKEFPDLQTTELNNVLTQGMNPKKKHEIEALAGIVSSVARRVGANTIVDVGAGQGYLAQVLSFQYQFSVYAIDACLHHGRVTDARAERIKKHYAAKSHKSRSDEGDLRMPKTVTCRVLSADSLKKLNCSILQKDHDTLNQISERIAEDPQERTAKNGSYSAFPSCSDSSLVLAGLHACGDLSVMMMRTFLDCEEVKAVVSIGCCYNLLSEEDTEEINHHCGFPLSQGVKSAGFRLGKNARDLACQSAERWKFLGKAAGIHNFELHAFRAAFQMVLFQNHPESLVSSPTIGRQGKALRRQQHWKIIESSLNTEELADSSAHHKEVRRPDIHASGSATGLDAGGKPSPVERLPLFLDYSRSGLRRLGLPQIQDAGLHEIWQKTQPFWELIGPYWSLRAALGPLLETIVLLDRLLFLQQQGSSLEVAMLPIFDPILSPRNVALIAQKM